MLPSLVYKLEDKHEQTEKDRDGECDDDGRSPKAKTP